MLPEFPAEAVGRRTHTLRRVGNPHGAGRLRNRIEPQQAPRQPISRIRRTDRLTLSTEGTRSS
jgi:hypothetical protein